MSPLVGRLLSEYHDLDPRDRRNALWVVSPDVYEELERENPRERWPLPELVEVGKPRPPESPARLFGLEVWVRYDLPPGSASLDVDDVITRAIKRTRQREGERVTINLVKAERLAPIEIRAAPALEVTLRALVTKWIKRVRP